jgi:hypothetical protein
MINKHTLERKKERRARGISYKNPRPINKVRKRNIEGSHSHRLLRGVNFEKK